MFVSLAVRTCELANSPQIRAHRRRLSQVIERYRGEGPVAGGASTTSQLVKFEMLLLPEPRAATTAAKHIDEANSTGWRPLAEAMQGVTADGNHHAEYGRFTALDQQVHDAPAAASGRPLLAAAVERWHTHLYLFRLSPVTGGSPATSVEHGRILCAVLRAQPGTCGGGHAGSPGTQRPPPSGVVRRRRLSSRCHGPAPPGQYRRTRRSIASDMAFMPSSLGWMWSPES
ncbi:FCD domain-containing protein [Streptomyces sp. NPDC056341]|uniref:FCD domain-containing protein n=1 Tax=Streptomyces sp. NPDC056341 TaxID=3345788 RepID=UPI0035D56CB2